MIEFDIAAPRSKVWEYFTSPGLRPKWRGADEVRESSETGRRGVNHCMHGSHAIIEEVLDWRPFDYLTLATLLPVPYAPKINLTFAFSETADDGTHVEIRVAKTKPKDEALLNHAVAEFKKNIANEVASLRLMIEHQEEASSTTEEPALPVSAGRFLTKPIHAH